MGHKFFITGTDTGIGKTYISVGLLNAFNQRGYSTIGLKPIASGCERKDKKLYNADALALQQAASIDLAYDIINPFAFEPPIAPHLAAAQINTTLSVEAIIANMQYALNHPADIHLIEGVGGWQVPLNAHATVASLVQQLAIPVILVVGIRLGCINHALLTYQAIQAMQQPLLGWVANCVEPNSMAVFEMIATLKTWITAPCLGMVQYQQPPEQVLDLNVLLKGINKDRPYCDVIPVYLS